MVKKIGKFIKFVLVLFFWSAAWLSLMRFIMIRIWNFDFFSPVPWMKIYAYWNKGGVIKGGFEYMIFVTLLITVILWYIGLKRLYHTDFIGIFSKPFAYFSQKQISKFESENKHIALKNLVVGEKITLDDLIEEKIKEEGNKQLQRESQSLRENISKKITERKGQ